jgi:predicted nucleic acid-binding protein
VLASALVEAHSAAAVEFLGTPLPLGDELVAPAFLLVECSSTLRMRVFDGTLTLPDSQAKLELMMRLPIRPISDRSQHLLALTMSARTNARRTYDAHYLAVASLEGAEIVTIDGGMYQNALNLGLPARLLR